MRGPSARGRHTRLALGIAVLAALLVPAIAGGHIERASYWPDPAPDTAVTPAAGGEVPAVRSLASAVKGTHMIHKKKHKHKHKQSTSK